MKKKTITKRWTVKAKVEVEAKDSKVIATLDSHELAMFIINTHEVNGLTRAIGRVDADRKGLWDRAAAKYGFEKGDYSHLLDLTTGEITKVF